MSFILLHYIMSFKLVLLLGAETQEYKGKLWKINKALSKKMEHLSFSRVPASSRI